MVVTLPIEAHREKIVDELSRGDLVLSSPTGSGKSTMLPQWCMGPVLVVEPRRVACQSLATRVAELQGVLLGQEVGYQVRDDKRVSDATHIRFVTPGIALNQFEETLRFKTIVLDEFHERQQETDLLLSLLRKRYQHRLVVMSATLDGDRIASYLEGRHLSVDGRLHPVSVEYVSGKDVLPSKEGVIDRLCSAFESAKQQPGDILVFMPGKSEIRSACAALERHDLEVLPLHGGLSLKAQRRAFSPGKKRRVIVATNVAETSITLPRIGVVIDSGLVRGTVFHQERAYLTLQPIAGDSAEQRKGRAGRLGPGICYRLWNKAARLQDHTAPALHRESLSRLVMATARCNERVDQLAWLDEPKPYAVEAAVSELKGLSAIDEEQQLTTAGERMFSLPLPPQFARFVIETKGTKEHGAMMDLVSALSTNKPLLSRKLTDEDEWYALGCDASVLIRALQDGDTSSVVDRGALFEARRNRERLSDVATDPGWRKERLIAAMVRADPRCVYVARGRKNMADHKRPYSNGGTEVLLGKYSLASDKTDIEAVVAVDTHAIGLGKRDTKVFISCASPIRYRQMFELGLGRPRPSHTSVDKGVLKATVEQVYAKRVIGERTQIPTGELAKSALLKHILKGGKFTKTVQQLKQHLLRQQLAHGLKLSKAAAPTLEEWLRQRIDDIGFESGDDFVLISPKDFLPEPLSYEVSSTLDSEYPMEVNVGDCVYAVEYDLEKKQVILKSKKGGRTEPPPRAWLPKFRGFKLFVEAGRRLHLLR